MGARMPPPILPRGTPSEQLEAQLKTLRRQLHRNYVLQGACFALGYLCLIIAVIQFLNLLRRLQ